MGYHSFSLDPRTILGVGSNASLDEIRDAYRAKSKKHHPDLGGDEWAFRMVARAYEVLKTTAVRAFNAIMAPARCRSGRARPDAGLEHDLEYLRSASLVLRRRLRTNLTRKPAKPMQRGVDQEETANTETEPEDTRSVIEPAEFRTVDVELIWTRFEKEGSGQLLSTQEGDDATLSVCMVISWPPHELIDQAAEFSSTGETLHSLIRSL